ncbi:MAG: O-antigen ligase family protein [Hyphomicrobium sp.]
MLRTRLWLILKSYIHRPMNSHISVNSFDTVCGWLFLAALVIAPAIFGGNVPLAWGLNAAVFGLLLSAYVSHKVVAGRPFPLDPARLVWPGVAFAIVVMWIALQAMPWTPIALHASDWMRASALLGQRLGGSISVNPSETLLAILRLTTAIAVFFLAAQFGRDGRWSRRIVGAIGVAAAINAIYAFVLRGSDPEWLRSVLPPTLFKTSQTPDFTGSFINKNHFAAYLGIGLICMWGLLLQGLRTAVGDRGLSGHRELIAKAAASLGHFARYSAFLIAITSALLLTGSRAVFLLVLLAMLLQTLFAARQSRTSSTITKVALTILVAGAIFALVNWGDLLGAKFSGSSSANDTESRFAVARIVLHAIAERPFTGFGYATFNDVFPVYRDETIGLTGTWREAHNSYLEATMGLGIPVAAILFAGLGWIAMRCLNGALYRQRDALAPSVACGAILIVGLHALVDFSIQIQGVALSLAALLGAGCAQSWSSRDT